MKIRWLLPLLFAGAAAAQLSVPPGYRPVTVAPSGSCIVPQIGQFDTLTGVPYQCTGGTNPGDTGTWTAGGGGSGGAAGGVLSGTYPNPGFASAALCTLNGYKAYDTFTGSTGALLSAHTGNCGNTWALAASAGSLTITLGPSYATTTQQSCSSCNAIYLNSWTPPSADYMAAVDCGVSDGLSGCNVVVRASADTANLYELFVSPVSTGTVVLGKKVSGTFTQLTTATPCAAAGKARCDLALRVSGSTLSVWVNNSYNSTLSTTDSSVTAAGKAGVGVVTGGGETAAAPALTNFRVSQ